MNYNLFQTIHHMPAIRRIWVIGYGDGEAVTFATRSEAKAETRRCEYAWARPATPAERAAFRVEQANPRRHAIRRRQWAAHRAYEASKTRHTAARLVAAYASGDGVDYPVKTTESLEHELWSDHSTETFKNWYSMNGNVDSAIGFLRDCVADDLGRIETVLLSEQEEFRYLDNQSRVADGHDRKDLDVEREAVDRALADVRRMIAAV